MTPLPALGVLDQFFLDARSRLLDLAATLDRIDRGADSAAANQDTRLKRIREALVILQSDTPNRAEQVQQLFSLDYDPAWRRPQPRTLRK